MAEPTTDEQTLTMQVGTVGEGTLVAGRYRLDRPVGRGRAGIVWLAFDVRLHRTVVAKPMPVLPGFDAERAGRNAIRVISDSAMTVHDVVRHDGRPWLAMEYVPSRGLDEFLAEHGRLEVEHVAALGSQIGSALIAAHAIGIVHGAVEPGNVLLADDGGVRLTDFSIPSGQRAGGYRAPEVQAGQPPTPASDAFSFGAVLYFAAEGVPPYGEHGTGEARPPERSGVLGEVLRALCAREPADRPLIADAIPTMITHAEFERAARTQQHASTVTLRPVTVPATQIAPSAAPLAPVAVIQPQQPPQAPKPVAPQWKSTALRAWVTGILAVIAAAAVGILFTELFLL